MKTAIQYQTEVGANIETTKPVTIGTGSALILGTRRRTGMSFIERKKIEKNQDTHKVSL